MRKAQINFHDQIAGWLIQDENGYQFKYAASYLVLSNHEPVSLTLPIRKEAYQSNVIFPFFDGLIPEGWLLDIAQKNWKLNSRDRMGLLMTCCKDCIGAVSVIPLTEDFEITEW